MVFLLDYEKLKRFWNKVKEYISPIQESISEVSQKVEVLESASLNYATKDEVGNDVNEVGIVVAQAVNDIKKSIGASDELTISFEGTNYLDNINNIKDALVALDAAIASIDNKLTV